MKPGRPLPIALTFFLFACTNEPAPSPPPKATPSSDDPTDGNAKAPAAPAPKAAEPSEAAVPALVQASAASPVAAKKAEHLGFKLAEAMRLHAIEGKVSTAPWSAAGTAPEATRDDDLDTAWTCTPAAEQPCALGIAFEEPAEVYAVRIYGAAGLDWAEFKGHPRISKVRLHTDDGFLESDVDDGADFGYVAFDSPVKTSTVTVEVIGTTKGKRDEVVHVAELEVFGTGGTNRPPLDLDPSLVYARYETTAWGGGGNRLIRQVFLEQARPGAAGQRLVRATALLGRKGDRFLLIERMFGTDCEDTKGSYFLLDQTTRVMAPLMNFGRPPRGILRHPDGTGFATVAPPDDPLAYRAVALDDDGVPAVRRPNKKRAASELLERLGFTDRAPLVRGGTGVDEALPSGCTRADAATLQAAGVAEADPSVSVVCELDAATQAVVALADACGAQTTLVVLDATKAVAHQQGVPERDEDGPGRAVRLTQIPGVGLVVETSLQGGDRGQLWRLSSDGIELLATGSLAVRPPAACDACHDRWSSETTAEPEAEE